MENPFSYSNYVTGASFCNRLAEQKDLIYFAKNSENIFLYSHRRMGKTSLLHQVMQRLKKTRPKINCVYIDLYGTLDENDFIDAVLTGVTQIESRIEKIFKQMNGLKLTGSIDPTTNLPTVSASIKPKEKPEYLEKALYLLASYSNKQKLLVVFDEFQEVAGYAEAGFEKRLRSVIQRHHNISYFFSGSQKHILIDMFDSAKRAFFKMEQNKNIYLSNYFTAPPMAKFKMIQELLDLFCSEIKKTGQSKKMMNRFRDFAEIQFDIFFNEKTSLFG